ncbi:Isopenicillin N synthase-like, Fe(2+) 2OG dioxygenase domain [Dillenia turbinata]|uniref:Isopenicillin N synthase-like, Fe(2+) 2OG dioxygenase domain n=1 Tax=Dillenia turbinata TaxID=194707 RepID=A0AAN8YYV3_9MAGN
MVQTFCYINTSSYVAYTHSKVTRRMASSLPILSLQELVKVPLSQIPESYKLVDEQELPVLSNMSFMPTVPIIDMKRLVMEESTDHELEKLHLACKEWGLFQLVNHGVSSTLVVKLKAEIEDFFKLPLEVKTKYQRKQGDFEGYGQTPLFSEDQKLDWADRLFFVTNPVHKRKPHLLPEFPPSLRDTMESYLVELEKLSITLLELLEKALKIKKKEMVDMFEDGMQAVRMTYYPPCPQPERTVGFSPHSDSTGITILLQVNQVEGLQLKKDGIWIPLQPLQDSFVVNVGDILEVISNGVYKSIEHKVTVNSEKERISIATFFNPKFEVEFGPATTILNPQTPPLFKRVTTETFLKEAKSRKLDGKSLLEILKINRNPTK